MKAFGGLQRLFSDKVDGFAPIDDPFVRPDRDETVRSMDLVNKGKEQGALNLPPPDAVVYDTVERDIVAEVKDHLNQAHIEAGNHIRSYENRLASLQVLYGLSSVRGEKAKTLGDIKRLVGDWRDKLSSQAEQIRASNREIRHFQKAHGLERPYHVVDSQWVNFAKILGTWLFETAGNTFFLSENNEMGIIGGVFSAALVSLINVLVGVLAGVFIWRTTQRREAHLKAIAWIMMLLWMAFVVVFNFYAGHFRDAQSLGLEDPTLMALALFSEEGFWFENFYSWSMLIVGMIAAGFVAYEAYGMDDPYPGYGKLGRRHEAREETYSELAAEAREELAEERNDVIKQTEELRDRVGLEMRVRGRVLAANEQLAYRFEQHHKQLEGLTNYLLKVYQDANRKARSEPAPAYFDQQLELDRPKLASIHIPPLDETLVGKAEDELNSTIEEVAEAFDNAIESFESIDALRQELRDGAADD
ncbi:hypothetical protein [Aurantiacibacter gilvus]|uniref:MFS transporter n=1 Tax=Aurantiacibacter gilvus TaxID=3139141 RepID=A0ABU9I9J1_9SPHN